MPNLTYTVADFIPFTKIVSADVNSRFNDIKVLLNTTKLDDTNLQNAGITRATKLKAGTADYVVINAADGTMSEEATLARTRGGLGFAPTLTSNAGKAIVVNDAESALTVGSPAVDTLTESFASYVSGITAGEAISANDAVCLDLHNGTGSNVYRVYKTDADLANRRYNFAGFAVAAATVTPEIKTWTNSANFVASNSCTWTINGRNYTQAFSVDNDTTIAACATQIAADPDVQSAVVTDSGSNDRVITITSKGALSLNISTPVTTGGASQPTTVIAQTQAPVGQGVRIRAFGPLAGFSGLTPGELYYLSGTAGGITSTPSDSGPTFVGQALDANTLFINRNSVNYQFSTPVIFVRSHGSSAGTSSAGYVSDCEHFNFTSWIAGTSDSIVRSRNGLGEHVYNGLHRLIDGDQTSGSPALTHRTYNKSTWSAGTNRSTAKTSHGVGTLSGTFYVGLGSTNNSNSAATDVIDAFNGSTWNTGVGSTGASAIVPSTFQQGGKVRWINGNTSGTGDRNLHSTFNGTSTGSDTAIGAASEGAAGSIAASATGLALAGVASSTQNYSRTWSGSAWSSNIATAATYSVGQSVSNGPAGGYSTNDTRSYINGGTSASTTSISTTQVFNGAWATGTASTNARAAGVGSIF